MVMSALPNSAIRRIRLIALLTCVVALSVGTAFGNDEQRKGQRHHLIDHKRVEAMHSHRHNNDDSGQGSNNTGLQAQVTDLQTKVAALASANTTLQNQLLTTQNLVTSLQTQVTALAASSSSGGSNPLSKYVTVDLNPINGVKGPHVIFTGVNVHVRSGGGSTDDGGNPTGLGNLFVGYNELPNPILVPDIGPCDRALTGSHNIVVGTGNVVGSYGGFVAGTRNCLSAAYATVLGGNQNEASGQSSTILGGFHFDTFSTNQTVPVIR